MRQARVRFTRYDCRFLPSNERYEILDGGLFPVDASGALHKRISDNLEFAVRRWVTNESLGEVISQPCRVILSEENVVQPDVLFVVKSRLGLLGKRRLIGSPDLIVEVLSEGSRETDLAVKRGLYERHEVREYWIADPVAGGVEVLTWSELGYLSAGKHFAAGYLSSPLFPRLRLRLKEVFGCRKSQTKC